MKEKDKQMHTYYRAFRAYQSEVVSDGAIGSLRDAIARAATEEERLETVRSYPIIDEAWIAVIEEKMVEVEKAVREDRQFIRQHGEVVPIEKARRVSESSVRHLARHSNYITHLPEDGSEDIIPDDLYIVENLSDYSIYENRFLYMLLLYTRDFIRLRLDKILELGRTARAETEICREISYEKRKLSLRFTLCDRNTGDTASPEAEASRPLIERMENQLFLISSLLNTPLMQEVSKAPLLSPPITQTNLLRMNHHFHAALELFHYLSSYSGKGYEIEEIHRADCPLPPLYNEELSEQLAMQTLLVYTHGNRLSEFLRNRYQEEEEDRRLAKEEEERQRLLALRARAAEGGEGLEAYLLLLEARNESLEKDRLLLQKEREKNRQLAESLEEEGRLSDLLRRSLEEKRGELRLAQIENEEQAARHLRLLEQKEALYKEALLAEQVRISAKVASFREACKEEFRLLAEEEKGLRISLEADCHLALSEKEGEKDLLKEEIAALQVKLKNAEDRILLGRARLRAAYERFGASPASEEELFSTEEGFHVLEEEFEYFYRFFSSEWARTKKQIRRDLLKTIPKEARNPKKPGKGKAEEKEALE